MHHESEENRTYTDIPTGGSPFTTPDDLPVEDVPVLTPVHPVTPASEGTPPDPLTTVVETESVPPITPDHPEPLRTEEKRRHGLGVGAVIIIALCCSLVGGALGVFGTQFLHNRMNPITSADQDQSQTDTTETTEQTIIIQGDRVNTKIDVNAVDTSKVMTAAEVYAVNINSVVGITTSVTTNYWGYQTTSAASGSGFILTEDGYILTNQHVIENSNSITVAFYNGTTAEAKLIGYDTNNDIAVLKVEATGLTPVKLGNSDNMNVGDEVIAIGNPLGELTFSLTRGVISALNREITTSTGVTMNLIQTDCAINSGNSGGPLFNLYGELVGITNAKYSGNSASGASIDNIGFAIPINNVFDIVKGIIEKGYYSKPYIGVYVADVSAETQGYGLPKGAAVKEVITDSPAEAAGLQINDIITHVDGTATTGKKELISTIEKKKIGDVIKLTIYRKGETLEITLTVGEKIQNANESAQSSGNSSLPDNYSGFPFEEFFGQFGY